MKTSVIGFPRIGEDRELRAACEEYFEDADEEELYKTAERIRRQSLKAQRDDVSFIPCGDFSFYDRMLDITDLLGAIPSRYHGVGFSRLERYFAAAQGYFAGGDYIDPLGKQNWFNTNLKYCVPELSDETELRLDGKAPFRLYEEAAELVDGAKPTLIGPYTFLKLARYTGKRTAADFQESAAASYQKILSKFAELHAEWVQLEEPALVLDMTADDVALFQSIYETVLSDKGVKVLLQTYFGDIRDCYKEVCALPFDAIGLDFVEGDSLQLIKAHGFPKDKVLFAGVVNGKNVWRNRYSHSLKLLRELKGYCGDMVIGTSCSLVHVPYTLENEPKLAPKCRRQLAFAVEKLVELSELQALFEDEDAAHEDEYIENEALFVFPRERKEDIRSLLDCLTETDLLRYPALEERRSIQTRRVELPLFPTTTVGSFPLSEEVLTMRRQLEEEEAKEEAYEALLQREIADCVRLQERMGLDVLVHGEFERGDMVEYFAEGLDGFLLLENAWVQTEGLRYEKPPIVWGDISRRQPITVNWISYAQRLTEKPLKAMLTGPVTLLNRCFVREDIPQKESVLQAALAIREEAQDLECAGISFIQLDEPCFAQKAPLRHEQEEEYFGWAVSAVRFVQSGLRAETQLHTYLGYIDVLRYYAQILALDADVVSFASPKEENTLAALNFQKMLSECGIGVYRADSATVPTAEELAKRIERQLRYLPADKIWVNPDCGLKHRGAAEFILSLERMVDAARELRKKYNREI